MELFRLSRTKYINKLSGKGAAIKGARWNSKGTEIIYTTSNRSLAMAEVAVHLTLSALPDDYHMLTIYVPDDILVREVDVKSLPPRWNNFPHIKETQEIGDEFITASDLCLLKLPSAVTKNDFNILINPFHSEFERVKIIDSEHFPFDERIFK